MNRFEEVMKNRSNAELAEIVSRLSQDYQPEAVEAAKKELTKRSLNPDEVRTTINEIEILNNQKKKIAEAPLAWYWKAIVFIFPVFAFFPYLIFLADKKETKRRETWRWAFGGWLFYFLLSAYLSIRLSNS